jgi:hypothetical protein
VARQTFTSALLAAVIGASGLSILVLLLNPELAARAELPALLVCLFLPWAAGATLALWLLAALATALRWWPRPFRPVVVSRPFFCLLTCLALAALAALYWHNLLAYRHAMPVAAVHALATSAAVVTGAVAVFLVIGLDVALFPRHERPFAAALAILLPAVSIAVPLALRPRVAVAQAPAPIRLRATPAARRVYVVAIDGLSPADVAGDPAVARVPWLAQLARRGAMVRLATVRPTEGPPVWTTILTGRLPRDNGMKSASSYRLLGSRSDWALLPKGALVGVLERARLVSRRSLPSSARRVRALWNVLDAFGIPCGLVDVSGTQPPETIRGFVVSPYFYMLRHDRARLATSVHPRDLLPELSARALEPSDVDPALLRELADPAEPAASPLEDPALRRLAEQALAPDLSNMRVADVLLQAYAPSFFVLAFSGYDKAGHQFYRYVHPEAFGNVPPDEARRYGHVLRGYTALVGRWVLGLEKTLRPQDVLVVISGHGLAPTPLWRRLFGALTGTEVGAASHEDAPPGVLVAVGGPLRPGAELAGASLLDVAPTLLYLMGLPVARDMEGRVLSELVGADFASDHPVTFIPSYQSLAVAAAAPGPAGDDLPPLPDEP